MEFIPWWSNPKMTKAQVKKYIRDMEIKRAKAQLELEKASLAWELDNKDELDYLDKKIDDLF